MIPDRGNILLVYQQRDEFAEKKIRNAFGQCQHTLFIYGLFFLFQIYNTW
jgi:hypothetical protein